MNTGHAWQGADSDSACAAFLARHSAYLDGELTAGEQSAHEQHRAACASCARYAHVLARGTELLREHPDVEPSETFELRLQHRIFHLQDAAVLRRQRRVSGWVLTAAVAAGVLVAPRLLSVQGDVAPTMSPVFPPAPVAHPHEAVFGPERTVFTTVSVPIALASEPATLESGYTPVIIQPPQFRAASGGVGAE